MRSSAVLIHHISRPCTPIQKLSAAKMIARENRAAMERDTADALARANEENRWHQEELQRQQERELEEQKRRLEEHQEHLRREAELAR